MQARHLVLAALAVGGLAPTRATPQQPARLRVWVARAIATVLAEVGPEFERTSGHRLEVTSDLPPAFLRRAKAGDAFDILISGSATVDDWIRDGRLVGTMRSDIARSWIGVEVRAGASKPDISTVDAFKRTLLRAKSIAYLKVGSGIYLDSLFRRLGVADAIAPKVTRPDSDIVSEMVAKGDIELGIVVITQILTTRGVDLVGPLPKEIQHFVTFTAGISPTAAAPDAARQLVEFLKRPTVARVIRAQGMEPIS